MNELLTNTQQINSAANRSAIVLLSMGSLIVFVLLALLILKVVLPLIALSKIVSKYDTRKDDGVRVPPKGVAEIKSLSANFNLMSDRLEQKRQDQLRFIAAVAHDLRKPLNSMAMASELLIAEGDEKDRNLSEIIYRQEKNLDRIVGDLLDTTRIEAGQLMIEAAERDLGSLVQKAVALHKSGDKKHGFKLQIPKENFICKFDRGRISQVINKLLSNAIKYSPNVGILSVKLWKEAGQAVISVADQGIGIVAEDLQNIFKPFRRAQATKNTILGIGLGLSTSRRIAEAHNGTLKVESSFGKGSVLYLTLPIQTDLSPNSLTFEDRPI